MNKQRYHFIYNAYINHIKASHLYPRWFRFILKHFIFIYFIIQPKSVVTIKYIKILPCYWLFSSAYDLYNDETSVIANA